MAVHTFSKSIAPTIRISYMVLPLHLMTSFRERMGFYSCKVSSFEQHILARFMEKGYFERHINRMRNFYKLQRDLVLKAIKSSVFNENVRILEEDAGLHFILHVNTDLSDREIVGREYNYGIKMTCLSDYYYGQKKLFNNNIVINYSNIERDRDDESVNRLLNIFK